MDYVEGFGQNTFHNVQMLTKYLKMRNVTHAFITLPQLSSFSHSFSFQKPSSDFLSRPETFPIPDTTHSVINLGIPDRNWSHAGAKHKFIPFIQKEQDKSSPFTQQG